MTSDAELYAEVRKLAQARWPATMRRLIWLSANASNEGVRRDASVLVEAIKAGAGRPGTGVPG